MTDPIDRWEPWDPHLELTAGPQHVYDDNPKPDPPHQPVGFVIPARTDEQEIDMGFGVPAQEDF